MMSTNSITDTIESNVDARGLAIIITNDYQSCSNLSYLSGSFMDGMNMKDTFYHLNFVVHWVKNIDRPGLQKIIDDACSFQGYNKFIQYKCIVFVFAGHGDLGDIVYLQDGSGVSIGKEIIQPFLPKASPSMGGLQKLFFFDACRGEKESESVMVPRGTKKETFDHQSSGVPISKRIRVPAEGGYLVAYSTMSECLAWENIRGGAWLQKLAEEIKTNTTSSIEDVLTKVNSDLLKNLDRRVQQPEKLSRLNKIIFLHPDKDPKTPPKADNFPTQPTPSLDRTQSSIRSAGVYQGHDQELSPPANSPQIPALPSDYKQRVNRFFQQNDSNPQYTFNSTGSIPKHRCIVHYTIQGEPREVDSVNYYSTKGNAKEQVAKMVLDRENDSQIVSKGITTPSNKVWKSKLKEHCDKNNTAMPSYCTKSSGTGFKSTVTFLECDIEGEECKSKQEAEQSAACNALQSV